MESFLTSPESIRFADQRSGILNKNRQVSLPVMNRHPDYSAELTTTILP